MKKPITELTTEELLKFIEENNQDTINLESNDVLDFISVYNIQSGNYKVTTKLLYKTYKMWSQNPMSRRKFTLKMQDFFPLISGYYSINKDPLFLKKLLIEYRTPKSKTTSQHWYEHFKEFLEHYSIKKGRHWVKDTVLYNLYDKLVYTKNRHSRLNLVQFNRFCKGYFKSKTVGHHFWYSLHQSIIDHLSWELRKKIRKHNIKT